MMSSTGSTRSSTAPVTPGGGVGTGVAAAAAGGATHDTVSTAAARTALGDRDIGDHADHGHLDIDLGDVRRRRGEHRVQRGGLVLLQELPLRVGAHALGVAARAVAGDAVA